MLAIWRILRYTIIHDMGRFKWERALSVVKKAYLTVGREDTWVIKAVVDLARVRERCIKRPARNARKNAKYHLSPEKIVRYIARIVSLSARIAAIK